MQDLDYYMKLNTPTHHIVVGISLGRFRSLKDVWLMVIQ